MPPTKRTKTAARLDSLGAALYCSLPSREVGGDTNNGSASPRSSLKDPPKTVGDDAWNTMFERLCLYKQQHGDCLVPWRYEQDPQLGNWVKEQRKKQKNNRLLDVRKQRLEEIDFCWRVQTKRHNVEPWENVFERLCEYKKKHGNCLVPSNYKDDPKLGRWVSMQRFRQESLPADRKERLESIGFV